MIIHNLREFALVQHIHYSLTMSHMWICHAWLTRTLDVPLPFSVDTSV